MKITSLRIRTFKNTGTKMVGVTSITFDNMIAVHDIKILRSADGLFLAMPSKAVKPGSFKDSVHPINATVRKAIEDIVFSAYNECAENDYGGAQFDVVDSFNESLLEQSFADFSLVSNQAYKAILGDGSYRANSEEASEENAEDRNSNAFLNWLNN